MKKEKVIVCLTDRKEKTQYISFPILEKAVKYIESIKEFLPFYDTATICDEHGFRLMRYDFGLGKLVSLK